MEEHLFSCLCPGQGRYSPDQAGLLASRLREVADSLEQAQQQPKHPADGIDSKRRRRKELSSRGKELDFGAYQQRYVALELLYLGHRYGGFAHQESTEETIEGHLFAALRTARLIPTNATWKEHRYSRGGRTDKGVSALGQVVALLLRSAGRPGEVAPEPVAELDYPTLLNRVLPHDIRVLGWADVAEDFSARFSAQYREYKYLIAYHMPPPQSALATDAHQQTVVAAGAAAGGAAGGAVDAGPGVKAARLGPALDIGLMQEAAAFFLGEHDFRNFCKLDVAQVTNFRRRVLDIQVEQLPDCTWGDRRLLQLRIRGTAFLWHQVRCMMAVLLMVGRGEEQPCIVQALLDIQRTPCKPQYRMASEEPLLLYSCTYGGLHFHRSSQNYQLVRGQLEEVLTSHLIRAGTLHAIHQRLKGDHLQQKSGSGGIQWQRGGTGAAGTGAKRVPLLLRAKEPAVEERLLKLTVTRGGQAEAERQDGEYCEA